MTEIGLVRAEAAHDENNNHNGKKLLRTDIKWLRSISLATNINNVNNNTLRHEKVDKVVKNSLPGLLLAINGMEL